MAYPEKGAKYAGEDIAKQRYRAEGGRVKEEEPDLLERVVRATHGGRDLGQRAFYNATRATGADGLKGVFLGQTESEPNLTRRRKRNAWDAEAIDRAVPRRQD